MTSVRGTKLSIRDVRCMVAIGEKADVSGKAHFGSDGPIADSEALQNAAVTSYDRN
jgi:hypothetical protein